MAKYRRLKWRPRKWNIREVERLAQDLMRWADETDCVLLEKWLERHKLNYDHFSKFSEMSDFFKDAYAYARTRKINQLLQLAL